MPTTCVCRRALRGIESKGCSVGGHPTYVVNATTAQSLPDLMDRGLSGSAYASTGLSARAYSGSSETSEGVYLYAEFIGWNIIMAEMDSMMLFLTEAIASSSTNSSSIEITWSGVENFSSFTDWYQSAKLTPSEVAQISLMSSRLLGRDELSKSQSEVKSYLQRVMASRILAAGTLLILGLQDKPGPANVPQEMRGALNPVWREAYLHAIVTGASVNTTLAPEAALQEAATWVEQNKEAVRREWAPTTGAYMKRSQSLQHSLEARLLRSQLSSLEAYQAEV